MKTGKMLGAAVAAFMSLVSCAMARTVDVTAQSARTVTLKFGSPDGKAYQLFLAHGATDQVDEKHKWDGFLPCGIVEAGDTIREVAVPAALRDGRYLRFFLMQTDGVNFAKELKSVASTGQQWVDTDYCPTGRTTCDFRFGDPTYSASTAFFGQNWTGSRYLLNQQSNTFYFHSDGQSFGIMPARGENYRCVIDDSSMIHFTYGTSVKRIGVSRTVSSDFKLAIFGCCDASHLAAFSFYRMKLALFGVMDRDYIPAVNAAGVAGLYDQVHDKFYLSKTDTALVAGEAWNDGRDGRVMDESVTFRFRRAVTVRSVTTDTVKLGFDNPDGAAYDLYVGYGTTDAGDRKRDWTSFNYVTTVGAGGTGYNYMLPDELKSDGVCFRFFLLKTSDLPYTDELASLTSTGAQAVHTGYIPSSASSVDMKFGNVTYASGTAFFGQCWSGNSFLFNQQGSTTFYFHGRDGSAFLANSVKANTNYHMQLLTSGEMVIDDGTTRMSITEPNNPQPFYNDLTIFDCCSRGKATKFRFDSMQVWDAGLPVRDLVPVVANGKGALFDQVMGVVYENVEATDFTRGNAQITRKGWVANTTATYTAAGVKPAWWAPLGAAARECDDGAVELLADCDITEVLAAAPENARVLLNGRTASITGTTSTRCAGFTLEGTGKVEVTVPAGQTCRQLPAVKGGPITFVKLGAGTLELTSSLYGATLTKVEAGLFKFMRPWAIAVNASVEVAAGAAVDMNGQGANCGIFTIAGEGPDGLGALRNSGASLSEGTAQLGGIILAADAKMTTTSGHFGLVNDGYCASKLELNGHTLTLDYCKGAGFWLANTSGSTAGTVYVKRGIPYFYNNSYQVNLPNVDFVADGADSIIRVPGSGNSSKVICRDVIVKNGGSFEEGNNVAYLRNVIVQEGGKVPNTAVKWVYTSNSLTVSNVTDVTVYPPFINNGTYPQVIKQGPGKLIIANNHTDQRFDRGLDLQEGTVVLDSVASTKNYHVAISSQPAPFILRAGTTLDLTKCVSPVRASAVTVEPGATFLCSDSSILALANGITFTQPEPFQFPKTLKLEGTVNFNLVDFFEGPSAPAKGATITLLRAGQILGAGSVAVKGCPYDYEIVASNTEVVLKAKTDNSSAPVIKIASLGGTFVYGYTLNDAVCSFRGDLAYALSQEGWNVEMTGWRRNLRYSTGLTGVQSAWAGYAAGPDLALKTSATRAGILEGLEQHCLASGEPDFTIFICGDTDVKDGVADATILANFKAAVTRIRGTLPMTTVIASTIPGGSTSLNNDIATWCAGQTEVECVDLASVFNTATPTSAQFASAAAVLKTKLMSLATASGKNTPTLWTRPTVTLGAENNVPAEYLTGFQLVRVSDFPKRFHINQYLDAVPYSYMPVVKETNIAKVGYYIELVREDTGSYQALWMDMDALGSTLADQLVPSTHAQRKQKATTKLHVWSNSTAVEPVAANDDSVTGWVEFNPVNYGGTEKNPAGGIKDPKTDIFGFDDTLTESGGSGHGCFQFMRKFADTTRVPAGEVLFTMTRWGSTGDTPNGIGIGTFANYGNLGYTTSSEIDRTFCYGEAGTEGGNISSPAYSTIRISIYVKYSGDSTPSRTAVADATWTGATDSAIWTLGNWQTSAGAAPTSFDYCNWLIPEGTTVSFTYPTTDNVTHWATTFMIDGTVTLPTVGGFYNNSLDIGPNGVISFDPTEFSYHLRAAPIFQSGGKFRLPAKYAASTKGRFLLFTVDQIGALTDAAFENAFDTASAAGNNPKMYIEKLADGKAYIWLDLDYGAPRETINVLCMGDSITHGSDSTYGNWRTLLAKKIEAAGYTARMKGHWRCQSNDINGQSVPESWTWHAGIGGQRIVTTSGGAGTLDGVEATLDQAGDVDFVLLKLGTNDINSNGSTGEYLYPYWEKLATTIVNQKPHAKLIAGAVVDIADATKNAKVIDFNNRIRTAIQNGVFPAGRAYFADLYTPCYRYDASGNYIAGSFYSATDLHPDWPGEVKMADTYLASILQAIGEADASWQLNAHETVTATSTGVENNVPAADRAGFKLARVFDIAGNSGKILSDLGYVPYAATRDAEAATENIARVGYYVELTRKDTTGNRYDGQTRWMWVTMDAFGGRTIEDVGVPLNTYYQGPAANLRVKTNMPGVESTPAGKVETAQLEFWPSSYSDSGTAVTPMHLCGFDWRDSRSDNMAGYGTMQVHRVLEGGNPGQVLFAFNRWTVSGAYEIGLGNFAHQGLGSIDWTFTGDKTTASRLGMSETMSAEAYEVAKLEIWTIGEDDPAAPGASTEVTGFVTEDGVTTVYGTLNSFGGTATSATVTLEWSTDPTFATVTGSTALGTMDKLGKLEGQISGLAANSTWYYRFTTVNSESKNGAAETSAPDTRTVAAWRPVNGSETWLSPTWSVGGAANVALESSWHALFDGKETTPLEQVTVESRVQAASVTVSTDSNYTFGGAGMIGTGKFIKEGAGTLTVDGAVLGATTDIEVRGGVLKAGAGATKGAFGPDGTTITVKNGGQVDVNYSDAGSGNDKPRSYISRYAKYVIEGAGPDGSGALVNNSGNVNWGSVINEIELAGDATIGGNGRMDMRGNTKQSITGPTNATLTIANTATSGEIGLNFQGPLSVGRMVINAGACITPETAGQHFTVPYGIDLYGGINTYNQTILWDVPSIIRTHGDSAWIGNGSGTSHITVPVSMDEGSTLTFKLGATVFYDGAVTNRGTIKQAAGGHWLHGNVVTTPGAKFRVEGGNLYFLDTGDWSQTDVKIEMTGGQMWWGNYDYGTYPQPKSLDVSGITAGSLVVASDRDAQVPIQFASANPAQVYVLNSSNEVMTTMAPGSYNVNGRLKLANAVRPGSLKLENGVNLKVQQLYLGDDAGNARRGYLEIGEGATFSVSGTTWLGHYPDLAEGHRVVLNGGTFNHTDTGSGVRLGIDCYKMYFDHNSGTANVMGLYCRREWEDPSSFEERYTLNGGVLNIGKLGLDGFTRYKPFVEFNNGQVNATDNFSVAQLRSVSFGNEEGGTVDFNIANKIINWQTGLRGKADVVLRGNGLFNSGRNVSRTKMRIQGVPTGHWTIANTGTNYLYGAAGFAGGLTLDEGVTAQLNIAGSNLVECTFMQGCTFADAKKVHAMPFVSNDMTTMQTNGDANDFSSSAIVWQGQFYCDTPGTWTFGGNYDDNVQLVIDGTAVLETTGWQNVAQGKRALTVGWHDFRIAQYQGGGGWGGTSQGGWNPAFSLGFAKSEVDGSKPANLKKFDGTLLPMRPSRSAGSADGYVNWSSTLNSANNKSGVGEFDTRTDLVANPPMRLSELNVFKPVLTPTLSASTHQFDGWVYVNAEQAGVWRAYLSWDDRISFRIDGRDAGNVQSTSSWGNGLGFVSEGWHQFRIRLADSGGGYGPWSNLGYFARICVNGREFYFDDRDFGFAAEPPLLEGVLHAGLDGVTEVKKGATLQNNADGACPIWGTLKGAGKLVGPFEFVGPGTCYEVSGSGVRREVENSINFQLSNENGLADLRMLKAVFSRKPPCPYYDVGAACGVNLNQLLVEVWDTAGNDYSEDFTAEIVDGRILLKNAHPSGFAIFFR